MSITRSVSVAVLVLLAPIVCSDTWDEPWQDQVITLAESFVLARVVACEPTQVRFELVKQLAGKPVPAQFTLDGYSLLGGKLQAADTEHHHHTDFDFPVGLESYLLIRRDPDGSGYQIPTPTCGFADIHDGVVYATYRHSYHQAFVKPEIYELTMMALFQRLKELPVDEAPLRSFVDDQLKQPPSTWAGGEDVTARDLFFLQHVALELLRAFGAESDLDRITPFLASSNRHLQISACRAISGIRCPRSHDLLTTFIEGDGDAFAKVIATWGLHEQDAREVAPRLRIWAARGGEDHCGFGGNIMDPRVGTRFPQTAQIAVSHLLAEWDKPAAPPEPEHQKSALTSTSVP